MQHKTIRWLSLVFLIIEGMWGSACDLDTDVPDNLQPGITQSQPDAGPGDGQVSLDSLENNDAIAPFKWCATSGAGGLVETRPLQNFEELSEKPLRDALYTLVEHHVSLSYQQAKAAIFVLKKGGIDIHDNMVECIYTGQKIRANGSTSPGGMNVEHSWPQSEGAGSGAARSDIHHLFPANADANSRRGNMPFGNTTCLDQGKSCKWQEGGSAIGTEKRSDHLVFEVRPVKRGDIARAQFYFSLRYQISIPDDEEKVLREWNQEDPPDSIECERNSSIEKQQKNRNPFVDRPDFVDRISDF